MDLGMPHEGELLAFKEEEEGELAAPYEDRSS